MNRTRFYTWLILAFVPYTVFGQIELRISKTDIHLTDTYISRHATGRTGMIERIPAPADSQFLCLALDIEAVGWTNRNESVRLEKKDFQLSVKKKKMAPAAVSLNFADLDAVRSDLQFYSPLPKLKTAHRRMGFVYVVPKDFKEGEIHVGKYLTQKIMATQATPLPKISDQLEVTMKNCKTLKGIKHLRRFAGIGIYTRLEPAQGKILSVTVEMNAKKSNSGQHDRFRLPAGDISLVSKGGGQFMMIGAEKDGLIVPSSQYLTIGESQTTTYLFQVGDDFSEGDLQILGENVAKVNLKK